MNAGVDAIHHGEIAWAGLSISDLRLGGKSVGYPSLGAGADCCTAVYITIFRISNINIVIMSHQGVGLKAPHLSTFSSLMRRIGLTRLPRAHTRCVSRSSVGAVRRSSCVPSPQEHSAKVWQMEFIVGRFTAPCVLQCSKESGVFCCELQGAVTMQPSILLKFGPNGGGGVEGKRADFTDNRHLMTISLPTCAVKRLSDKRKAG